MTVQATPAALCARNLRVRYRSGALGILDVSFEVHPGKVVGIFGPNGAGKTTTARAVSGFLRSEGARVIHGSVELFGQVMTNAEPQRMSQSGVALVPERRKIFPNLTVAENLMAVGTGMPKAKRLEVYQRMYTLFPILQERRRQQAGRLSGGQRQMLAIARALVNEPRILIVDEMTLGLHHSIHAPLFDALEAIAKAGTSVIVIDESTGFALKVADYCYLINGGRVVDEGPRSKFQLAASAG